MEEKTRPVWIGFKIAVRHNSMTITEQVRTPIPFKLKVLKNSQNQKTESSVFGIFLVFRHSLYYLRAYSGEYSQVWNPFP